MTKIVNFLIKKLRSEKFNLFSLLKSQFGERIATFKYIKKNHQKKK